MRTLQSAVASSVGGTSRPSALAALRDMKEEARQAGIEHCDILDRERLRIELDSPGGFFVRFQHLEIPLSVAEQASFLARYGDRIQEVVSTGFQRIERTLMKPPTCSTA